MKTKADLEKENAALRVELIKAQAQRDTVIDVLKIVAKEQRVVHHDYWGYRSWPWTYTFDGSTYCGQMTCNEGAISFTDDPAFTSGDTAFLPTAFCVDTSDNIGGDGRCW